MPMKPENTFSADAAFCEDGNGTTVVSSNTNGDDGSVTPSVPVQLPATGGVLPAAGAIGAVLLASGLIARRVMR